MNSGNLGALFSTTGKKLNKKRGENITIRKGSARHPADIGQRTFKKKIRGTKTRAKIAACSQ